MILSIDLTLRIYPDWAILLAMEKDTSPSPDGLDMSQPITEEQMNVALEICLSILPPEQHLGFLKDMARHMEGRRSWPKGRRDTGQWGKS